MTSIDCCGAHPVLMASIRVKHVVFSHGKESGPWGTKIQRLAKVAQDKNLEVTSVDYRGIDDPTHRVEKLLGTLEVLRDFVLVGSSMGGYVAAAAAEQSPPAGLFLMAPALYVPGYEQYEIKNVSWPTVVVHGWRDEVIPVSSAWRFAERHQTELHVLNDDHRLSDSLSELEQLFARFLISLGVSANE